MVLRIAWGVAFALCLSAAWDPKTQRLVVTSGNKPDDRVYLVKMDPVTGALTSDERF